MPRKSDSRKVVISFRVFPETERLLAAIIADNPDGIMGVKSTRTLARRIVIDFARGRLVYMNPEDFTYDQELLSRALAESKEQDS